MSVSTEPHASHHATAETASSSMAPATDPVCGMAVDASSPHRLEHDGREYRFCCDGCLEMFRAEPARYATAGGAAASAPCAHDAKRPLRPPSPQTATQWTCPMHPEVLRDGPGSCPKCGMALEPLAPTLEEGENAELRAMRRRFWVAAALSVPLLVLTMGEMLLGHAASLGLDRRTRVFAELVLATPVCTWAAWPF